MDQMDSPSKQLTSGKLTEVPALDRFAQLSDCIAQHKGISFADIQQTTAIAKSSLSKLLKSMEYHGFVHKTEGKYYLGLRFHELGGRAIKQYDLGKIAAPILQELRDKTHLTCHLGVMQAGVPIYLAKVESPQAIIVRSWEGKRLSLHSTGLGKVMMAWMSEEEVDTLIPDDACLESFSPRTITSKSVLKKELKLNKSQGWAVDDEEDCVGARCLAVPVFDGQEKVIAALSASGVGFQLPAERDQEIITDLKKYSLMITQKAFMSFSSND